MRAASLLNLHHLVRLSAIAAEATFLSPLLYTSSSLTRACGFPVSKVATSHAVADLMWTAFCPRKKIT